jgi:hypothetical protein
VHAQPLHAAHSLCLLVLLAARPGVIFLHSGGGAPCLFCLAVTRRPYMHVYASYSPCTVTHGGHIQLAYVISSCGTVRLHASCSERGQLRSDLYIRSSHPVSLCITFICFALPACLIIIRMWIKCACLMPLPVHTYRAGALQVSLRGCALPLATVPPTGAGM